VAALSGINCDCEVGDDWCSSGESCKSGQCSDGYGCGWLWLDKCSGLCKVDLLN